MAPADSEAKIQCPTPQHLQSELESLASILALGEKEETWDKMEKALIRFAGVTRGGGYKHLPLFTDGIGRKGCASKVAECMLSDRGRLSTAAVEFLQAFAPRLHQQFAPVVQPYFEPLLKLFARPNKVFLKRSERCLTKILENCQLPQIILELRKGLNDDAVTCRRICSVGLEKTMNQWEIEVFTEKSLIALEEGLRRMATDKDAEVRQTGKRVWNKFAELWPERVDDFSAPLTPTIRRYLNLPAQGVVAKGKGKAKAVPPARPVAVASTSVPSTSNSRNEGIKPKPLRVAALTTKSSRPALRQAPPAESELRHPAPTTAIRRDPSPKKVSPKKVESRPVRQEAPPFQAPCKSMGVEIAPSRPDMAPLPHGRSASHAVLPTAYSSTSVSDQNPLARPSRPVLPQSFSTTALPSEASSSKAPYVGRFATGPIRIVRPAPISSHDDTDLNGGITIGADGFMYTPSGATVFGGPSRPPPHAQAQLGHGRKPTMGTAHRRIVTAPLESGGLGLPARTPAANKFLSRSVKGKVEEVEEFPFSAQVTQAVVTNPQTPAAIPRIAQDSPILPVLRANIASQAERVEDVRDTSMIQESIKMIRELEGPVPVELAVQIPLPPDEINEVNEVAAPPTSADTTIAQVPTSTPSADLVEVILLEEETPTAQMSMASPAPVADEEAESPPQVVMETIHRPVEEVEQVEAAPAPSINEPPSDIRIESDTTVRAHTVEHIATDAKEEPAVHTAVDSLAPLGDIEAGLPRQVVETIHRPVEEVEQIQAASSPSSIEPSNVILDESDTTVKAHIVEHSTINSAEDQSASASVPAIVLQEDPVEILQSSIVSEPVRAVPCDTPTSFASNPIPNVVLQGPAPVDIVPELVPDIPTAPLSVQSRSTSIPPSSYAEAVPQHVVAQKSAPADIFTKPVQGIPTAPLSNPSDSTLVPPIAHAGPVTQPTGTSQPKAASAAIVSKPAAASRVVSRRLATSKPAQTASSSTTAAPAPARKPPVPRAAAVSRVIRPVERKPFRPATAAQTAALAKSRVVSQPALEKSAEPQSSTSSRPPVPEPRSRQVSASSSQAASSTATANVTTSTAAPAARPISKPSTLLAPTKASTSRAGPTASQPRLPSSSTTISSALPPVRKEKIKLKAALPSFRPVRNAAASSQARSTSGPAPTLGNGTIKSSSSNRSTTSQPVARPPIVRVKPETIPLPHSPVSAASRSSKQAQSQVRPEQVALPASPDDRLATKVRPEAMPLPPSPAEKAPISVNAKKSVVMTLGTSSSRHIRITPAEAVPLPDSPIATRDDLISTTMPGPSSAPAATQVALPLSPTQTATEVPLSDSPLSEAARLTRSHVARHSIPQVIALQEAERGITPTPSASTMSDLDSDSDSEEGDDLTGVTFKVRPDGPQLETATKLKPKAYLPTPGDLMEFSPSGKTGMFIDKLSIGSTTPKYTPGRKALVSRDANVSSPLVIRGPLVDEEDDEDW